jgi:hypothetical protein
VLDMKSSYGENGELLPQGQTRMVKVLKVSSVPLTTLKNKEGKEVDVRASELFNLKYADGKYGISGSPKSKIQRFLAKYRCSDLKELKGKQVIVKANTNPAGNTFLGFVI